MAESDGAEYRCFVGSLSWNTDDRGLEAAFSPFGEILDAKVRRTPILLALLDIFAVF